MTTNQKKGNEMTPGMTDPRFMLVQGRNTYIGTGQTTLTLCV